MKSKSKVILLSVLVVLVVLLVIFQKDIRIKYHASNYLNTKKQFESQQTVSDQELIQAQDDRREKLVELGFFEKTTLSFPVKSTDEKRKLFKLLANESTDYSDWQMTNNKDAQSTQVTIWDKKEDFDKWRQLHKTWLTTYTQN